MADLPINLLDAIVIAVLLISGFFAFIRGLTREVLSIFAWVGAVIAVSQGYLPVQPYVQKYVEPEWVANIVTAGGIFLISLIVLTLVSHGIAKQVQASAIGALDRSLGFVFGLVRGGVIVTIAYVIFIWVFQPAERPQWVMQARSLSLIETSADLLLRLVPSRPGTNGALALPESIFSDEKTNARPGNQIFRNLEQPPLTQEKPAEETKSGQDKEVESGYKAFERRLLDRVIQATQDE